MVIGQPPENTMKYMSLFLIKYVKIRITYKNLQSSRCIPIALRSCTGCKVSDTTTNTISTV